MVAVDALSGLAADYRARYQWSREDVALGLRATAKVLRDSRVQALIDAVAVGVAIEGALSLGSIDQDSLTAEAREAFELAYPNVPIESLPSLPEETLAGMVNAWKGKLFEVSVRDRLNEGEWVGDHHLEPDQVAVLAESATQPGWDLRIIDQDGETADLIQLKATESFSYVREALDRYPDIPIIATSDLLGAGDEESISVASISEQQLQEDIGIEEGADAASSFADGTSHAALPLAAIVVTEGFQVLSGGKSVDEAFASGGKRAVLSSIAAAVGGAVGWLLGPIGGALAGFATRYFLADASSSAGGGPKSVPRLTPLLSRHAIVEGQATRVSDKEMDGSEHKVDHIRRFQEVLKWLSHHYPYAEGPKARSAEPDAVVDTQANEDIITDHRRILSLLVEASLGIRNLQSAKVTHRSGKSGTILSVWSFHGLPMIRTTFGDVQCQLGSITRLTLGGTA